MERIFRAISSHLIFFFFSIFSLLFYIIIDNSLYIVWYFVTLDAISYVLFRKFLHTKQPFLPIGRQPYAAYLFMGTYCCAFVLSLLVNLYIYFHGGTVFVLKDYMPIEIDMRSFSVALLMALSVLSPITFSEFFLMGLSANNKANSSSIASKETAIDAIRWEFPFYCMFLAISLFCLKLQFLDIEALNYKHLSAALISAILGPGAALCMFLSYAVVLNLAIWEVRTRSGDHALG